MSYWNEHVRIEGGLDGWRDLCAVGPFFYVQAVCQLLRDMPELLDMAGV